MCSEILVPAHRYWHDAGNTDEILGVLVEYPLVLDMTIFGVFGGREGHLHLSGQTCVKGARACRLSFTARGTTPRYDYVHTSNGSSLGFADCCYISVASTSTFRSVSLVGGVLNLL